MGKRPKPLPLRCVQQRALTVARVLGQTPQEARPKTQERNQATQPTQSVGQEATAEVDRSGGKALEASSRSLQQSPGMASQSPHHQVQNAVQQNSLYSETPAHTVTAEFTTQTSQGPQGEITMAMSPTPGQAQLAQTCRSQCLTQLRSVAHKIDEESFGPVRMRGMVGTPMVPDNSANLNGLGGHRVGQQQGRRRSASNIISFAGRRCITAADCSSDSFLAPRAPLSL